MTPSPFYFRGSPPVADIPLTIFIRYLSRDVLKDFLDHLEHERHCKIRTRNQRLAAIHAMARFVAEHSPEDVVWCARFVQYLSSVFIGLNSLTWKSPKWMHYYPLRIVTRHWGA